MAFTQTCLALLVLVIGVAQATPTTNFDKFFPFWDPMLQEILRENCSSEYATYKTGEREPGSPLSGLITPVINCILETLPEFKRPNSAPAPSSLTLGSTPAETALLGLRRPILATLLALGSPSVAIMRTSDFMTTISELVEKGDTRPTTIRASRWRYVTSRWRMAMSVAEYLVTMLAVATVVYLAYQLGFNAVVMLAPGTIFLLPLWTFICIIIHLGGVLILYLKLHIDHKTPCAQQQKHDFRPAHPLRNHDSSRSDDSLQQQVQQQQHYSTAASEPSKVGILRRRTTTLSQEFTPAAFQEPTRLRWRRETILVNFLIWLLSIGTLVNLVLGSMIFSSLLFFSVRDVLLIVGRYFVSTLICRAIVRIELSGMKECTYYEPMDDEDDDDDEHRVMRNSGAAFETIPLKNVQHPYGREVSG
ncbi:uncharacterized protein B0I36DRAFT_388269 [Microdochium trichocladiopsis]|uniref:Uncharacterized protein n=1 Tax=Microdochium trichocladiopsis TaxID=1682393 RepID=A0A9P8XTB6_9PEZI|nr:uncharacterized protein B0I36DRAFT_388269 [Microdochium trichocladiopsis]KAH7017945.1 hypothetical protein B0I36DRAFT_388269 [Microdochium trichocladiopsis]